MKKNVIITSIIVVVVVVAVLVLLIPVKSVEITKKENIKQIESVRIIPKEVSWNVKWYNYDSSTGFNKYIGNEDFPGTFKYKWGESELFQNYINYVRLEATTYIYAPRSGLYKFELGADDGVRLLIDGKEVMSYQWQYGGSYGETSKDINMKKGKHKIELNYYEKYAGAGLKFSCPSELLSYEDTIKEMKDTVIITEDTTIVSKTLLKKLLGN